MKASRSDAESAADSFNRMLSGEKEQPVIEREELEQPIRPIKTVRAAPSILDHSQEEKEKARKPAPAEPKGPPAHVVDAFHSWLKTGNLPPQKARFLMIKLNATPQPMPAEDAIAKANAESKARFERIKAAEEARQAKQNELMKQRLQEIYERRDATIRKKKLQQKAMQTTLQVCHDNMEKVKTAESTTVELKTKAAEAQEKLEHWSGLLLEKIEEEDAAASQDEIKEMRQQINECQQYTEELPDELKAEMEPFDEESVVWQENLDEIEEDIKSIQEEEEALTAEEEDEQSDIETEKSGEEPSNETEEETESKEEEAVELEDETVIDEEVPQEVPVKEEIVPPKEEKKIDELPPKEEKVKKPFVPRSSHNTKEDIINWGKPPEEEDSSDEPKKPSIWSRMVGACARLLLRFWEWLLALLKKIITPVIRVIMFVLRPIFRILSKIFSPIFRGIKWAFAKCNKRVLYMIAGGGSGGFYGFLVGTFFLMPENVVIATLICGGLGLGLGAVFVKL